MPIRYLCTFVVLLAVYSLSERKFSARAFSFLIWAVVAFSWNAASLAFSVISLGISAHSGVAGFLSSLVIFISFGAARFTLISRLSFTKLVLASDVAGVCWV